MCFQFEPGSRLFLFDPAFNPSGVLFLYCLLGLRSQGNRELCLTVVGRIVEGFA